MQRGNLLYRQAKVADAEDDEADDGEAEGEDLDAAHGVDGVQRDVDDLRHVAREQGDGHGDVEQDIRQWRYMRDGEGAQQQVDRYGDEEIRQFIGVLVPVKHFTHILSVGRRGCAVLAAARHRPCFLSVVPFRRGGAKSCRSTLRRG